MMMNERYYQPMPQTEAEERINHVEKAKAKARYCSREGHFNSEPVKVGGSYIGLCPKCQVELKNHLEGVISRHARNFKVVAK